METNRACGCANVGGQRRNINHADPSVRMNPSHLQHFIPIQTHLCRWRSRYATAIGALTSDLAVAYARCNVTRALVAGRCLFAPRRAGLNNALVVVAATGPRPLSLPTCAALSPSRGGAVTLVAAPRGTA
jgi:hypothetical protein